jgi:hypothetical protein
MCNIHFAKYTLLVQFFSLEVLKYGIKIIQVLHLRPPRSYSSSLPFTDVCSYASNHSLVEGRFPLPLGLPKPVVDKGAPARLGLPPAPLPLVNPKGLYQGLEKGSSHPHRA